MSKEAKDKNKKVAKKKKEAPKIERYNFRQSVKCELSKKEIEHAASELARNLDVMDTLDTDRKNVLEQIKAKVTACQAEIVRLKGLVRDGCEYTEMDVEEVKNFTHGTIKTYRVDNGECVSERKMTAEEGQMNLLL